MKTDANARWLVSPDVRSTYSEDGAVLLDIRKGLCYSLNVVGARMWLTIDASQTGITLDGIVGALPAKGVCSLTGATGFRKDRQDRPSVEHGTNSGERAVA